MLKIKLLRNMKSFIKNNKYLSIFLLFFVILIPILVFATGEPNTGYKSDPGTVRIIQYNNSSGLTSSISYQLINAGSVSYFIPTRTLSEWESFVFNFDDANVTLEDYCGNGLCGVCAPASSTGTTAQRLKYLPPSTNLKFSGYSYACENEVTACPADCGTIFCGDGDCDSSFYEDYSNCTADCKYCSSNDYYHCQYSYSGDKTGNCSDAWSADFYVNHCSN